MVACRQGPRTDISPFKRDVDSGVVSFEAVSDDIDPTVLLDYERIKLPSNDDPDSNREPFDQK